MIWRRVLLLLYLAGLVFAGSSSGAAEQSSGNQGASRATPPCPVTIGRNSPIDPTDFFGATSAHWNGNLYVGALWPEGTIIFRPGGSGHVYPDGSVGMKISWYRAGVLRGKLTIAGKRLDASAPALRSDIGGDAGTGFEPSLVIFPTEGCWEVTGKVADASVTFVTRVVKLPGLQANER